MSQLVECVPNFSEGRRPEVIAQIVGAIEAVGDVTILGHESDADHNRTVVTLVGAPAAMVEAVFNGIAKAAGLIDLDVHTGEHPRLGATDVVPFIPIDNIEMSECVQLARELGQRVGDALGIPVYLYEEAATRPDRVNLADVRRGQYERLKQEIGTNPDRVPDYGPAKVGKAGATVIGARAPLIAFNVYLTTENVEIAKKIAWAVRHQSGGLHYVKALGLLVDGQAQVSMNLTNYRRTPVYRVVELVRREAARFGVAIERSELVGLIPQKAMYNAAKWYMQMDGFTSEQVLEVRLANAQAASEATAGAARFLDALAAGTPTPGGGSAAAFSGAMAAGLVGMVARVTAGKKKYARVEAQMQEIAAAADQLRQDLHAAVRRDAQAFDAVMAAMRLPKGTPEQQATRLEAIEQATYTASEVPLSVVRMAGQVLRLAADCAELGNVNAVSDAGSAGAMAQAAITAAGMNVRINASGVQNREKARGWLDALSEIEQAASVEHSRLHAAIRERGGITF